MTAVLVDRDAVGEDTRITAVWLARAECQARLEAGQPMRAVEAYIEALPVDEAQRRTVQVFARSYGERAPLR